MTDPAAPAKLPRSEHLHPLVYKVMVGLLVWLILAVWGFFSDSGYTGLELFVVTLFALVAIAIPYELWRIARRARAALGPGESLGGEPNRRLTFSEWTVGEFTVWQGKLRGSAAAVIILLPLAASAIGMTIFAIIFHLDAGT